MIEPNSQRRSSPASRLIRLCSKELREILRDRRTIITLVLMPLLVYPVLILTFNSFLLNAMTPAEETKPFVAFESEEDFMRFQQFLAEWSRLLGENVELAPQEGEPEIQAMHTTNVRKQVAENKIDLAIIIAPENGQARIDPGRPRLNVELVYRANSALGISAADYIERRLEKINRAYDVNYLKRAMPSQLNRVQIRAEEQGSFSFATVIPLILILMTITGAVYPAIDLTAGERERGTMEALIAAPIPRLSLLIAKYVAVLVVALLTATANLVAMTITLMSSPLGGVLFGEGGVSFVAMAQIFSLMILFAAFFAAVLLAVTSFARSFKEAQAYLIPLMLLSLGPGVLSLTPGIELTPTMAIVPLLNIVILARDSIQGEVSSLAATMVIVSTAFYALAAISLAARVFGTDAILYGSQASWGDLVRRPKEKLTQSSVPAALLCLALLFPLQFLAASVVSKITAGSQPLVVVPIEVPNQILLTEGELDSMTISGVPERSELSAGTEMGNGVWVVAADDLEGLTLRSNIPFQSDVTLGFDRKSVGTKGSSDAAASLTLTAEELQSFITLGRSSILSRLIWNAVLTILLFAAVPILAATWQNVSYTDGLRLHIRPWVAYPFAIALGFTLWMFAHELVVLGQMVGIGDLESKAGLVETLIKEFKTLSPIVILLTMAVTPAVCEELFFRGLLLQSFMGRMPNWGAIVASGLLFGAFHLIGNEALAVERFLPSTFLGLFLGWLCVRSGSVLPGMLLHTIHNGFLLMLTYYRDTLVEWGLGSKETGHLPATWLLTGVLVVGVCVTLLFLLTRKRKPEQSSAAIG